MLISEQRFERIYKQNKVMVTCLVLIVTNECNANCKVCLGTQVFKSKLCKDICEKYTAKCVRCCDHIATDEEFYAALDRILATINSPIVDIIITGGEPTISPRLLPTLEIIDKYNFMSKVVEMETNGANLADPTIVDALKKRNVQMHLSRYAVDEKANAEEFGCNYGAVTNNDIRHLAQLYGEQLGVSTVMLKKNIPNAKALLELVDYYEQLGVHQHSFLELMADTSLRAANRELLEYYDEQHISAAELSKQLVELGCPLLEEQGCDSFHVYIHEYKNTKLIFTMSDLSKQHKQETNNGFSRFLIMPSGEIGVNGIEKR